MLLRSQRFRHDVRQVVVGGDVGELQLSSGMKVPAVVELHIDVLVPAFPVSSPWMFFNALLESVLLGRGHPSSPTTSMWSLASHWASRAAYEQATYSASVVESATIDCLLDFHETGPL